MATFKDQLNEATRTSQRGKIAYNSILWFRNTLRNVAKPGPEALQALRAKVATNYRPGMMTLFVYDPKGKKTLPYYDTYPLIFPLRRTSNGFYGVNLHYLPPEYRVIILDKIYAVWQQQNITDPSKMKLSQQILEALGHVPEFKPCLKRYLNAHVRSLFMPVPMDQWNKTIFLNIDNFKKATREEVWRDSIEKIG